MNYTATLPFLESLPYLLLTTKYYCPIMPPHFHLSFLRLIPVFSEEAPPPPPPPVVYSRYADDTLRSLIQTLRERTQILKDKAIDPYATSPEISPPVSKYEQPNTRTENKHTNTVKVLFDSPSLSLPVQHLYSRRRTTSG